MKRKHYDKDTTKKKHNEKKNYTKTILKNIMKKTVLC